MGRHYHFSGRVRLWPQPVERRLSREAAEALCRVPHQHQVSPDNLPRHLARMVAECGSDLSGHHRLFKSHRNGNPHRRRLWTHHRRALADPGRLHSKAWPRVHVRRAEALAPLDHGVSRRAAGPSHRRLRWSYGGLQPNLRHGGLPFSAACLATGAIWGLWHLSLWFTQGAGRETTPLLAFVALAVLLSFWLSALYRAGGCAFSCCLLHALANTLIGVLSLSSISLVMAAALALTGLSLAALPYSAPTRALDRSAC